MREGKRTESTEVLEQLSTVGVPLSWLRDGRYTEMDTHTEQRAERGLVKRRESGVLTLEFGLGPEFLHCPRGGLGRVEVEQRLEPPGRERGAGHIGVELNG